MRLLLQHAADDQRRRLFSDLLMSWNLAELMGQDGILQPIGNRPLTMECNLQEGRLAIGRRIPSCPTLRLIQFPHRFRNPH